MVTRSRNGDEDENEDVRRFRKRRLVGHNLNYALMLGPSRRVESFGLWIASRIQLAAIHTTWLEYLNNLGMLAPYASLNLHFAIRQADIGYPSSWWAENQRGGHSRSKWYFAESERWQDWAYKGLVLATQAIANVVKSSFGPSGLDKMMVDDIGVRYPAETH